MKDLNNGAATPKLELSFKSNFWGSSPFVKAFQEFLEEMSSEGVGTAAFIPPFEDKTGALDKQEAHYTKIILYDNQQINIMFVTWILKKKTEKKETSAD